MFDFDGKWTAKDAARGYAPCKLQYYLSNTGKKKKKVKSKGCPGGSSKAEYVPHPLCLRVC